MPFDGTLEIIKPRLCSVRTKNIFSSFAEPPVAFSNSLFTILFLSSFTTNTENMKIQEMMKKKDLHKLKYCFINQYFSVKKGMGKKEYKIRGSFGGFKYKGILGPRQAAGKKEDIFLYIPTL
jgi:hypothetical protein